MNRINFGFNHPFIEKDFMELKLTSSALRFHFFLIFK